MDDRLPTSRRKLYFSHSDEVGEFWTALLEKAYAKLHGCYENLDVCKTNLVILLMTLRYHQGGHIFDAMVDFTGGYSEYRMLDKDAGTSDQEEVFSTLLRYHERGSLLGCGIFPRDGDGVETSIAGTGLVDGHAYTLTGAARLDTGPRLVRVRNPWGSSVEWTGSWADRSREWDQLGWVEGLHCLTV